MNIEKYIGMDNGICHIDSPLTPPTRIGGRGEAIYTVKTIYTDITVDGVKDPAYDYGVHLKGLTPREVEYYKDRPTDLEIWMIRGQNGRLYVYGEVTDPDIFFKPEYILGKLDECDGINLYFDYNAIGIVMNKVARVLAVEDPTVGYGRKLADTRVVFTDKGFNFEFSIDKNGKPFENCDTVGFSFYYHDTNNWKSDTDYTKNLLKLSSPIDKITPEFYTPPAEYFGPASIYTDTIVFSAESASGRIKEDKVNPFTARKGDLLCDILGGEATVGVISGGKKCAVQTMFTAANLCSLLNKGGANAYFINEGSGSATPNFDYEILINRAESGKNHHFGKLGANEYAVEICDGYVLIYGALEKTINKAKDIFLSYVERIANGESTSDLPGLTVGAIDELPANVPMLKGLDHITDVGDDAYMLMNQNATEKDLVDYVKSLEAAGYKLYTHNQMGGTRTATYVGFGNVINLSLTTGENHCLRVVAEPLSRTALPALTPPDYEKKVTPQVTMVDPTNLCMIYRLENGEFLILDSGQAGHADKIYNILTRDGNDHPVIAAWFFSHHHQDHTGSFINLVENDEYLKNVTVKKVIYNFPQKLVLDTSVSPTDQNNLKKWRSILDKTGAEIIMPRTGQKHYFAGAELEILWTYEDIMPYNLFIDDTNVSCTGYRLTIAGQTHMLLGDSSEEELRQAVKNLGKYVKSDFVQLAHHGCGSVHSPFELYENVDAPVVFIPGISASGKAEKWAADNAKEVYIRKDGTVTLDLPHVVK